VLGVCVQLAEKSRQMDTLREQYDQDADARARVLIEHYKSLAEDSKQVRFRPISVAFLVVT
jgi:hypothetical protein